MTAERLLVLALDAANADLLHEWSGQGHLPNLARLMSAGLVGASRGVDGFYVGSTWPSFYTGMNPARHGLYWTWRLRPGTYRLARCQPEDFGRFPALWDALSAAGKRCVVLDVPLSRLSPGMNGVQSVEWGVHDALFGFQATPGLEAEILRAAGRHPAPVSCDADRRTPEDYRVFAAQLAAGAAARGRMTQAILGGHPWDFAIQVFSETHCAGHQLWHTHDPHHPAHRAGEPDLLLEVYRAVDQAIGEIVSAAGPRTTIAVIALHSMSHITGASQLLHDVLVRLGYTTPAAQVAPRDETPLRGGARRALAGAWRRMPSGIRDLLQPLRRRVRDELVRVEMDLPFDPAASRCFYLDTGFTISSIRLNLRGREPLGIVAPGAEADALVRDLTAALLALENPDTGRPAVRSVRATADVWQGERLAELPDLLVEWDDSVVLGSAVVGEGAAARLRLTSPRTGMLERVNDYCRTGEHRPPGMFIVAGPGIRPGRLAGSRPTLDLAPTFAAMLGTAMPGVDGKAIAELLA